MSSSCLHTGYAARAHSTAQRQQSLEPQQSYCSAPSSPPRRADRYFESSPHQYHSGPALQHATHDTRRDYYYSRPASSHRNRAPSPYGFAPSVLPHSSSSSSGSTTAATTNASFAIAPADAQHGRTVQARHNPQRRGPWSQEEDKKLLALVPKGQPTNWVSVSAVLETRTPKQCRERFHQNLKADINHDPITEEEGRTIERLVGQKGRKWAEIARALQGRSDNAVKNWWNGNENRKKRHHRRQREYASSQSAVRPSSTVHQSVSSWASTADSHPQSAHHSQAQPQHYGSVPSSEHRFLPAGQLPLPESPVRRLHADTQYTPRPAPSSEHVPSQHNTLPGMPVYSWSKGPSESYQQQQSPYAGVSYQQSSYTPSYQQPQPQPQQQQRRYAFEAVSPVAPRDHFRLPPLSAISTSGPQHDMMSPTGTHRAATPALTNDQSPSPRVNPDPSTPVDLHYNNSSRRGSAYFSAVSEAASSSSQQHQQHQQQHHHQHHHQQQHDVVETKHEPLVLPSIREALRDWDFISN